MKSDSKQRFSESYRGLGRGVSNYSRSQIIIGWAFSLKFKAEDFGLKWVSSRKIWVEIDQMLRRMYQIGDPEA
jgi:hypothetical protein